VLDCVVSPAHRLSLARRCAAAVRRQRRRLLVLSAAALAAGDRDWWRALRRWRPASRPARARTLLARLAGAAASCRRTTCSIASSRGRVRERTVAVVPPEQRALALDAIDARAGAGAAARRRALSPRRTASCARSSAGR
jgi:ATP-dependent helicase/nuclease subunit A